MAASKGRSFVLQIGDGDSSEAFNTVQGQRSISVSVTVEGVEITNKDSAGIRTLLEGAGTKSLSGSISGVAQDDTYGNLLRTKALAGAFWNFRIIDSDTGDYFTSNLLLTQYDESGEHNGAKEYSCNFDNTGAFTFTEV